MLLVEPLPLLPNRIPNRLLDLSLALADFSLAFALSLILSVFKLVVPSTGICALNLSLAIQTRPSIALDSILGLLNVFSMLGTELLKLAPVLGLKADLFVFDLITEQVLTE